MKMVVEAHTAIRIVKGMDLDLVLRIHKIKNIT